MVTAPPVPQLVATVPGAVFAVRANGATIGWMKGVCSTVQVVVHGRVVKLGDLSDDVTCNSEAPPQFAVSASGGAIWSGTYFGNDSYTDVFAARGPKPARGYWEQLEGDGSLASGDYLGGVASAAGRLFYSHLVETSTDGCVGAGGACVQSIVAAKSTIERVGARRSAAIKGLPPALDLRGGDDRLALLVPETNMGENGRATLKEIDVYRVPGLHHTERVPVRNGVLDFAVSRWGLSVLYARSIEHWDASGHRVRAVTVPPSVQHIALSGNRVVYAVGRTVHLLDPVRGRDHVLARARGVILGLAFARGRVVWAERAGSASRLFAVAP